MQNQVEQNVDEGLEKIQLYELDLGTNFSGYPLENMGHGVADEVQEIILENNYMRFTKNKKYKLKIIMEEYKWNCKKYYIM